MEITEEEAKTAIKAIKQRKAAGPYRVTSELLQAAGKVGLRELTREYCKRG
jgi:hypothetical protein